MCIEIPGHAKYIMKHLRDFGYEAYIVGGCVRDILLGRSPEDWDITTSAKPLEIKQIFHKTIDTGIAHGTVTVLLEKEGYEVTTYRIDGEYEDSRHPKSVEFTSNLVEDLKRRDFTINAMAYHPDEGLIDVFGGKEDLQQGVIRCVGDPLNRFEEDALRMLRAIRFSGQLNFLIDPNTKDAIVKKASTIQRISAERIHVELNKLLLSNYPEKLMLAYEMGITKYILPEFDLMLETTQNNPHHMYSVGEHSIKAVRVMNELCQSKGMEKQKIHSILCWTMLLHDVGKPRKKTTDAEGKNHFYGHPYVSKEIAMEIFKRLRFDKESMEIAIRLIEVHDYTFGLTEKQMRKAMNCIGDDLISWLFMVQTADILAQSEYQRQEKLEHIKEAERIVSSIREKGDCIERKNLAITGKDLLQIGYVPGKELGIILERLLEQVIEDPNMNEKSRLLGLALEWKENN